MLKPLSIGCTTSGSMYPNAFLNIFIWLYQRYLIFSNSKTEINLYLKNRNYLFLYNVLNSKSRNLSDSPDCSLLCHSPSHKLNLRYICFNIPWPIGSHFRFSLFLAKTTTVHLIFLSYPWLRYYLFTPSRQNYPPGSSTGPMSQVISSNFLFLPV